MIDFAPLREKSETLGQFQARFAPAELRQATNDMIDTMLALIADCTDADVVFVPVDEQANDPYAADDSDRDIAWTLGHVIVHATASSEESAALAAEMARGVPPERRRSRYEVPWQTVTTIAQCRDRLEESRRMRLASLDMWPDEPHLTNTFERRGEAAPVNAIGRFLSGLAHGASHLDQIREIAAQARAARGAG
jgi:hypothetical protein